MAFVIDAYARRIVGWKVSTSATAGFVLDARNKRYTPAGQGRKMA
jgi:transposase InsO family protein